MLASIRETFSQRFTHSDLLSVFKLCNNNIKHAKELLDKKDPAIMCYLQGKQKKFNKYCEIKKRKKIFNT